MWLLESRGILSSSKFGYRKSRSTLDPLLKLDTYICSAFASHKSVFAAFSDLEKAYGPTWKHHIPRTPKTVGVQGNVGVFIHNFLSRRLFRARVQNILPNPFPRMEAVPQDCVHSTTLFWIAINDILTLLIGVYSSLYVDDFAIYTTHSAFHSAIQTAIFAAASSWTIIHGFRVSTENHVLSLLLTTVSHPNHNFSFITPHSRTVPLYPFYVFSLT